MATFDVSTECHRHLSNKRSRLEVLLLVLAPHLKVIHQLLLMILMLLLILLVVIVPVVIQSEILRGSHKAFLYLLKLFFV